MRLARGAGLIGLLLLAMLAPSCAAETAPAHRSSSSTSEPAPNPSVPTPRPPTPEELRLQRAEAYVDSLTPRQQIASVVMSTIPGIDAAELGWFTDSNELGGFLLMGNNIPARPEDLASLTTVLHGPDPSFPRLIAIDEEGGQVTRLPWDGEPGADTLRFADPALARNAFSARAALLREAGITTNFGIVADLGSDPNAFIYWRTLGDGPNDTATRVAEAVAGERGRVASTVKHFPGHGASTEDSHLTIPQTPQTIDAWRAGDAVPFTAGIDAGAELLMFGHLSYTAIDPIPASLSKTWHAIARDELGFDGVIVTDDLGMLLNSGIAEYSDLTVLVTRALAAGNDLVLIVQGADPETFPSMLDAVAATVDAGGPSSAGLRESAVRVAQLRLELGAL